MASKFTTYNQFPPLFKYLHVDWDSYAIGKSQEIIGTDSVSACLAITLYDSRHKIGALAHISGLEHIAAPLQPNNIIATLIAKKSEAYKSEPMNLEATLAGEGELPRECKKRSTVIRKTLNSFNIPIIGEDLSRGPSRLVFLYCDSGRVEDYRA